LSGLSEWDRDSQMGVRDGNGVSDLEHSGGDPTAAALFGLLWETMAEVLGTAATAVLVRRAARRAAAHWPVLQQLVIHQDGLAYQFRVPKTWQEDSNPEALAALRALGQEVCQLLHVMTGAVVIRRLARVMLLRRYGIIPEQEV
jgi:hypothetical protein